MFPRRHLPPRKTTKPKRATPQAWIAGCSCVTGDGEVWRSTTAGAPQPFRRPREFQTKFWTEA